MSKSPTRPPVIDQHPPISWTAEGKREVGYWIDRAFWGRGVATEALSAFLCLEPIRPLHAGVAKHNLASIRVLQKCGFKLAQEQASNDADASHVLLTLTADLRMPLKGSSTH